MLDPAAVLLPLATSLRGNCRGDRVLRQKPDRQGAIYKAPAKLTVYDWSGFYVGAYAGADWGSRIGPSLTPIRPTPRFAGFLGGGEIRYNHQLGKWVLGVEGPSLSSRHGFAGVSALVESQVGGIKLRSDPLR